MRKWMVDKRKSLKLTQEKIAKLAKIARTTYAMYEQGKRRPSVPVAKRLAKILKVKWTLFFEDECHESRTKSA
ncbi:helix-turn-helix transcriptional regulator [Aneurinibacillus aneurinilyticus]|uniref:DNA-binding helix-turn-helix protein n=1 Tax=Aneurinibacillus aneurinilyticus ATCC 12856 TaxID=649747 RepID=U1YJ83_ANEAE|nr:helix-turn-helix transcriptional regulator [Aneurinibacillus aneurinilyticus]ERI10821.1 DNA-binding helix-turn-helix protein [Aneurinibacillus aneurinilyticus ATCC 12856]MED0705910.1 helix-turn-helix transcriptional regulator [Aneurinibacillus aneurinilyticus]MED0722701.1 helix-turn-helix transcriptional regulator [Aneurinibacillus aneurinilyticus]MED0731379.1 helix-turn-helix transcriptional regulator [Aneurinibacillus aneurinilyticus]MED0740135.1 helix-turn-helix transcriptional regulator